MCKKKFNYEGMYVTFGLYYECGQVKFYVLTNDPFNMMLTVLPSPCWVGLDERNYYSLM